MEVVQQSPAVELEQGTGVKIARVISLVLHPFLISPLGIVLLLYLDSGRLWTALGWAGLCAAFVIGPALLYLRHKLQKRHYTDADISVREHRYGYYLFGGACMVICFGVLIGLGAPALLIRMFVAAFCGLATFYLINRFWTKISIHAGAMAGVTVAVALYSLPLGLLLALGTLLVSWARLVLKRHTLRQALLGWTVAALCVLAVLAPNLPLR